MSQIARWTKKWAKQEKQAFKFYTQISSTNDSAKKYLFSDKKHNSFLFITESQTKGRGRRNRRWINSDMMLSWSYPLNKAPEPKTTVLMGKALCTALKKSWGACAFAQKKPNDIYIKKKKLAGILIEVVSKGNLHQLVVGAGMNVFSHPLGEPFTHLQEHLQPSQINQKSWSFFLSEWRFQIEKTLKAF